MPATSSSTSSLSMKVWRMRVVSSEVLFLDHDVHRVLLFVDRDAAHFGRCERVDDKLRRIGIPQNDVDALAGELRGDGLDARAAHADAGADRIDARIFR